MKDKMYVLLYPDGGYLGIDSNSGGYPWNAGNSLHGANIWYGEGERGKEDAIRYRGLFPKDNFILNELNVTLIELKNPDSFLNESDEEQFKKIANSSELRLHLGEMTAQELRTAKAAVRYTIAKMKDR